MFLSYSRSSKLYFLIESLVNKVSSLNSHSACCWKFRKIFSLRASSSVMEPIIYGKPKVPTASWILEKVLKFARQFSKPWKNLLCKWIFFFVLVKSYSISPVSLQRHHEKSFVPAFLRSLLITYLITLSLEKILNLGSNICTNPENLKRRDHR